LVEKKGQRFEGRSTVGQKVAHERIATRLDGVKEIQREEEALQRRMNKRHDGKKEKYL